MAKNIKLEGQMSEFDKRIEKIKKLKEEFSGYPNRDIIEDDGEFYVVDKYGEEHPINVKLREELPNSYFHSPDCDKYIIGYDPITGSIIYNLWNVGKTEMRLSEDINSHFQATCHGIANLLFRFEKYGVGDEVPPTHILPPNFIADHFNMQDSFYYWGYYISLVNAASKTEQHRKVLKTEIENSHRLLEEKGDKWPDEFRNDHQNVLEDLKKRYYELGKSFR